MRFVDIPCDNCGKIFRKAKSQHKLSKKHFCSRDCQYAYGVITLSCAQCGQSFTVRRSMSANRQYCSIRCAHDAETIHRKTCPTCGKEFIHQTKTHCSLECRISPTYAWTSCPECGKEFRYYRKYPRKYCSKECFSNGGRAENLGEYTEYLGGRVEYRGDNWQVQRRRARRRDNYTCQRCGIHENETGRELDVHHIKRFRLFGLKRYKEANKLDNLICLCQQCHRLVEHNGL